MDINISLTNYGKLQRQLKEKQVSYLPLMRQLFSLCRTWRFRSTAKREGGERSKYYNNVASNLTPRV